MGEDKGKTERVQPSGTPSSAKAVGPNLPEPQSAPSERRDAVGGLDQIREILFGAVQRELERRVQRADGHLASRAHELEQEMRRRTEILEAHIRKETEALVARLERDVLATSDSLRRMSREQRDSLSELEQRLAKVEESSAHGQRELRHQLLEQAKSFLDELQQLRKELLTTLANELGMENEAAEGLGEAGEHARH